MNVDQVLFKKIPQYFEWRKNENKFFEMSELILKEDLDGLNSFWRESSNKWRELSIFISCLIPSNTNFILQLKDEMEDFTNILNMSCLAGNIQLCKLLISSCDVRNAGRALGFAVQSKNKDLIDFLLNKFDQNTTFIYALYSAIQLEDKDMIDLFILKCGEKRHYFNLACNFFFFR